MLWQNSIRKTLFPINLSNGCIWSKTCELHFQNRKYNLQILKKVNTFLNKAVNYSSAWFYYRISCESHFVLEHFPSQNSTSPKDLQLQPKFWKIRFALYWSETIWGKHVFLHVGIATGCNVIGRRNFLAQKLEAKTVSLVCVHCYEHRFA